MSNIDAEFNDYLDDDGQDILDGYSGGGTDSDDDYFTSGLNIGTSGLGPSSRGLPSAHTEGLNLNTGLIVPKVRESTKETRESWFSDSSSDDDSDIDYNKLALKKEPDVTVPPVSKAKIVDGDDFPNWSKSHDTSIDDSITGRNSNIAKGATSSRIASKADSADSDMGYWRADSTTNSALDSPIANLKGISKEPEALDTQRKSSSRERRTAEFYGDESIHSWLPNTESTNSEIEKATETNDLKIPEPQEDQTQIQLIPFLVPVMVILAGRQS
ncbi:unnamed protein product [Ambrosiozyma monospora]|uniref:Unnamed protein product n=1 Tax=Ambrosiozyma monospora TaxID=43982 RepID=A0A9W6T623_AMBMO|nr:unnamed protein product [Ambrosiozyma monospora]